MLEEMKSIQRVVTSTSREPRKGERDTVEYYFFAPDVFEARIAAGDFYEYAKVHGKLYGVLKSEVQDKVAVGTDLLLNIDVQGAATFFKAAQADPQLEGRVVSIFIMPPTIEELERRLRHRGTDDDAEIQRRLKVALEEIQHRDQYDYVIDSASRDEDFEQLSAIYRAEKMRVR